MQYFVGLDIGGTNTKAILLNSQKKQTRNDFLPAFFRKRLLNSLKMPTRAKDGKKKLVKRILNTISAVSEGKKINAIGIALAGTLDKKKELVERASNLKALEKIKLKKIVEKKFRVPSFLENDAKAAAFAESRVGKGKKAKRLVLLTLGTGIGSGIIIGRELFSGATEAGHMIIDKHGYKCGCGNFGCLEAMANAAFIKKTAKALARKHKTILKKFDPLSIQHAAEQHDWVAMQTYRQMAENLGIGLANICNIINPDLIVLAGGISNAKVIYPILRKKMKQLAVKQTTKQTKIIHTKIGNFAGAIGAALIAMQNTK